LACLVAGDRHHHIETETMPALAAGEVALSDRVPVLHLVLQRMDRLCWDTIRSLNAGTSRSGRLASGRGRLVADPFGPAMKWRDMIRLHTVPRVLAADR
jgi:hypothetical protein